MEFIHETTLQDLKIDIKTLPESIKGAHYAFVGRKKRLYSASKLDKAAEMRLKILSASIADDIITDFENKKPESTTKRQFTAEEKAEKIAEYKRLAKKYKAANND